ncbi:hypothetical protein K466DRAFT_21843 [Polyporus arcularius HHB13444]|uniref:Secreted protein n=1 Tax=Polyporus arcularius HHB13444 TaxID=1314778 RepID=A0A5C3PW53_9APHY|nr:hypothetical protein K466DRAFT_21843 [Polyporus arcularius HHB13444]
MRRRRRDTGMMLSLALRCVHTLLLRVSCRLICAVFKDTYCSLSRTSSLLCAHVYPIPLAYMHVWLRRNPNTASGYTKCSGVSRIRPTASPTTAPSATQANMRRYSLVLYAAQEATLSCSRLRSMLPQELPNLRSQPRQSPRPCPTHPRPEHPSPCPVSQPRPMYHICHLQSSHPP